MTYQLICGIQADPNFSAALVASFLTFRKGPVICCGLRVDFSGMVMKKNARN